MSNLISVSYCADHKKGPCYSMDSYEHVVMLNDIVDYVRSEVNCEIVIVAVGFDGFIPWKGDRSHTTDILWKTFAKTRWVTVPQNPGYLDGANWNIYQGLSAANALGCDFLIHMDSDVLPHRGELQTMFNRLKKENLHYIGKTWRTNQQLSTQFFGCYVPYAYKSFNAYGESGLLVEDYMYHVMRERKLAIIEQNFSHTHTFSEFQQNLRNRQ